MLSLLAALALGAAQPADMPEAAPSSMEEVLATTEAYAIRPPESKRTVKTIDRDLLKRVRRDQKLRQRYVALLGEADRESVKDAIRELGMEINALDAENTAALKGYVESYGWFPTSEWDWRVPWNAWLLVQHADKDPQFQQRVLATMAPLAERGEVSLKNYAYLYDRVAKALGVPQRWATQGTCTAPGVWEPRELEDPDNIDTLRNDAGMEPLDQYAQYEARRCGAAD